MRHVVLLIFFSMLIVSCQSIRPITATSNKVSSKKGKACHQNLLWIIPLSADNTSIYAAARKGNINKISTVDEANFSVLGIYNEKCTIVRGK